MTYIDLFPFIALGLAAAGVVYFGWASRRIDAKVDPKHPAE